MVQAHRRHNWVVLRSDGVGWGWEGAAGQGWVWFGIRGVRGGEGVRVGGGGGGGQGGSPPRQAQIGVVKYLCAERVVQQTKQGKSLAAHHEYPSLPNLESTECDG